MDRRKFIRTGGLLGIAGLVANQPVSATLSTTPSETAGPFYPVVAQKDKDFDLTIVDGKKGTAQGTKIYVVGKVVDKEGSPVEDATVELWQANGFGRYRHPHDSNKAPLDENFQGWAIVQSGKHGGFKFKTVMPGPYPVSGSWTRPPHIHFKISERGFVELVTQMYFPDMHLNAQDRLLMAKHPNERELMIAQPADYKIEDLDVFLYQIVLQKV